MQTIKLNDGNEMPQLGFGVFQVPDLAVAEEAVTNALQVGYRLIDTATAYGNEEAVGKSIAASGLDREEVFVTSKLWVSQFTYDKAKEGIDQSLAKLGLDYRTSTCSTSLTGMSPELGRPWKRPRRPGRSAPSGSPTSTQTKSRTWN